MTKRQIALGEARVAGYHNDAGAFIRAYCEHNVSRVKMNAAWHQGIDQKLAGMKCGCIRCELKEFAT